MDAVDLKRTHLVAEFMLCISDSELVVPIQSLTAIQSLSNDNLQGSRHPSSSQEISL